MPDPLQPVPNRRDKRHHQRMVRRYRTKYGTPRAPSSGAPQQPPAGTTDAEPPTTAL